MTVLSCFAENEEAVVVIQMVFNALALGKAHLVISHVGPGTPLG